MRIGIVGPKKAGKSLLAYKFSRYLVQKGVSAKLANFDVLCKRLTYKPDFDLREYYRVAPEEAYIEAFKNEYVKDDLWKGVWVVDFSSGLDWLLFSILPPFCDIFLLVVGSPQQRYADLTRLFSSIYSVPFVLIVNLSDTWVSSQQTLSPYTLPKTKAFSQAVLVNAQEREGFDELWEIVRALAGKSY